LGLSIVAALELATHPTRAQEMPAGTQQGAAIRTGFIAGQVVEVPSGRPVPDAVVTVLLRGPAAGGRGSVQTIPAVITDSQGRFFFAGLPAGRVTIVAERQGFSYGRVLTVDLAAGERVVDSKFRMTRLASLAGVLRDDAGDPVVNTEVVLSRRAVVDGRRTLARGGSARSDDRGAYRVSGLMPGDYIVCACSRDPNPFDGPLLTTLASQPVNLMSVAARALIAGPDVVSLDDTVQTYPVTFHPASATIARAGVVSLAPGDEKTGVDITLPRVRATRVSGRIVGARSAVQASSIRLVPALDAELGIEISQIPPMLVQADGRFDFATVPPGQYRMIVRHRETGATGGGPSGIALGFAGGRGGMMPPPPPPPPPPPSVVGGLPGEAPLWASELVTVPEDGVSGLVIALSHAAAVRGRVQYVGGAPQPPAQMFNRATVSLRPILTELGAADFPPVGRMSPDASFIVPGALPGKYAVTATALPGFPTLKSVVVDGVDITDLPLTVERREVADVVITFVDTPPASLSVSVAAIPGQDFDGAAVLLFPVDSKYWAEPAAARRRFLTLSLTNKGTATAPALPSGDYFVLLASEQDAADWQEPSKIELLSRRAQRITLLDGEKKSIEVRR
jgi:hypothetical protein